jgi:hypothetical protein
MSGAADMAHNPLRFQILDVLQPAVGNVFF